MGVIEIIKNRPRLFKQEGTPAEPVLERLFGKDGMVCKLAPKNPNCNCESNETSIHDDMAI